MSEPAPHRPSIRYSAQNGIASLIIDQPAKMNAMTFDMWSSLPELVDRAENDPDVRLIVLRGEGRRAFCAGADISQFGEKRDGAAAVAAYDQAVSKGNAALAGSAKPTLALISGICFGGGFGLAMCCDLRIAAAESRFRIPAARLGLGYAFSNLQMLAHKLGVGPTADLLLSARIIDATEAAAMGIVNAVLSTENFESEAQAYAARIAGNAPLTLKAVKAALVELAKPEAQRNASRVDALVEACFSSDDYREGRAAFGEKREPVFRGR
jgi:enoyl-CoA hydratase/carnithine racemase